MQQSTARRQAASRGGRHAAAKRGYAAREQRPALPQDSAAEQRPAARQQHRRSHAMDSGLLISVSILIIIGLVALFSASYTWAYYKYDDPFYFISKQAMIAAAGFVLMLAVSRVHYQVMDKTAYALLGLTLLLLLLVLTPLGTANNGAQRWIFGFQPSEFAKLSLIVCYARWMAEKPQKIRKLFGLIAPYGLLLVVFGALLYFEPHTSAMMILGAIGVAMLIVGGMRLWYFIPIGVLGAGALIFFYNSYEHVRERFAVWFDPFQDIRGNGLQGAMSQIAIGSGGVFGLGLGQGRQKQMYLPEPQNDFIFATWCEEMGLIGAILVIALFSYAIYRGFDIARKAPDRFSAYLAAGLTIKFTVQTLLNLCVVTGVLPITGASLPFFSYGGTALLMQMGEIGILLSISRYTKLSQQRE